MMNIVLWLYIIFELILIIALLRIITRLFLLIVFQKQTLPFVPTNSRVAKQIAALALFDHKVKVVDLGSGTGTLLAKLHAKRPLVEYVGVEQSWLLVWLTRLRFLGNWHRPSIVQGDMFAYPIQTADVIVGFWISDLTPDLVKKFEQEAKVGCIIVSVLFALPASARVQLQETHTFARTKVYIYEKI